LPSDGSAGTNLPWVNLNQIKVKFAADAQMGQGDLTLHGVRVPNYAIAAFTYDAATTTGTWTLAGAIQNDKLRIVFGGNLAGAGAAGGYRFNVLVGDVNHDTAVTATDTLTLKPLLTFGAGNAAYSAWADLNGDGAILGDDVLVYRTALLGTLPDGEPSGV
jgi:hypothetical protein